MPDYDADSFHSNQSKVHLFIQTRIIEKNKKHDGIYDRFEAFWKSLTEKQKTVIKHLKMGDENKTASEIARALNIETTSLIDRYKAARKKLLKAYPHLKPISKKEPGGYSTKDLNTAEIQEGGFFRKSEYEKLRPITWTNIKTGVTKKITAPRVKLKETNDANRKQEIFDWINQVAPAIKASDFS